MTDVLQRDVPVVALRPAHLFHGNVNLMAAGFLAMGGILGATIGSRFSEKLSDQHLQKLFVALLLVVAVTVAPVSFW